MTSRDSVDYLFDSIREQDCDAFQRLVAAGGVALDEARTFHSPDNKWRFEGTPLHCAAVWSIEPAISLMLIDHRVNVNAKKCATDAATPLHFAVGFNSCSRKIVDALINNGADINIRDQHGMSPLHRAAAYNIDPDIISTLLKHNAALEAQDAEESTPLHQAAATNSNPDVISVLLANKANLDAVNVNKSTPLHLAAEYNQNKEIVALLLSRGANARLRDSKLRTVLHNAAAVNPNPDVLLVLLDHDAEVVEARDDKGRTPLHLAAANTPNRVVVKTLLERNACLEARNRDGNTPLHYAARNNPVLEVVAELLDSGAQIEARNLKGQTPLHLAAASPNFSIVNLLVSRGADTGALDYHGQTPLHLATTSSNPDIVNLLVSKGANTAAQDCNGKTPLHTAAANTTCVDILRWLVDDKHAPPLEMRNVDRDTVLHLTAFNKNPCAPDLVDFLVSRGASLQAKNKEGMTPLQLALVEGNEPVVNALKLGLQRQELSQDQSERPSHRQFRRRTTRSKYHAIRPDTIKEPVLFHDSHRRLIDAVQNNQKSRVEDLIIKDGALHKVVHDNQLPAFQMVMDFLKRRRMGVSLLKHKWQAMTVLELACQKGFRKFITHLYAVEPKLITDMLDRTDAKGQTLAHFMAKSIGNEDELVEYAEILINKELIKEDHDRVTPILLAIQNNLLKLLDYFLRTHPEMARVGSPSPIWTCAVTSNLKAARLLMPYLSEADHIKKAPDKTYPLLVALVRRDQPMADLLTQGLPQRKVAKIEKLFRVTLQGVAPGIRSSLSPLQALTHFIPVFNEHVSPSWSGSNGQRPVQVISVDDVIKPHVLDICGLEHCKRHSVREIFKELDDCPGTHRNEASNVSCLIFSDLIRLSQKVEDFLANRSIFGQLKPMLVVIGSMAEGTRIGIGNEIDITMCFEELKSNHFLLGESAFHVRLSEAGLECLSRSGLRQFIIQDDHLDVYAWSTTLMMTLVEALDEVRLPVRLKVAMRNRDYRGSTCPGCQKVTEQTFCGSAYSPLCHCMDCLPGVTMTKLGPCLVLVWQKDPDSEPIPCSVDLIPVLPHSRRTSELFKQTVRTLVRERPEGWEKTMRGYLDRDRVIALSSSEKSSSFALKVQNFGPQPNFLMRAGQTLEKEVFQDQLLKQVYICLKGLKPLLDIHHLKSYFVKKVLLKPQVQEYARKNPSELQLFYEAICQPELRPYFEGKIDLAKLRRDIECRKTSINITRIPQE